MSNFVDSLKKGQNLSFEESKALFNELMEGKYDESSIIEILESLLKKGETKDELAGGIFVLREKATKVKTDENTIDVLCKGSMDQGDVLGAVSVSHATNTQNLNNGHQSRGPGKIWSTTNTAIPIVDSVVTQERIAQYQATALAAQTAAATNGAGLIHNRAHKFDVPIDTKLHLHTGKRGQSANVRLVEVANAGNFKIQQDYYTNRQEYWGPNHRLLDTAYAVAEFTIGEGETTIPSIDFIVRGKLIEYYNYDYSYTIDSTQTSAAISNFEFGDTVALKNTSNNSTIKASITIADIYSQLDESGTSVTRVRFAENPNLGTVKQFYMELSGNKYYLQTYDAVLQSGTVPSKLETTIGSTAAGTDNGVKLTVGSGDVGTALGLADIISVYDASDSATLIEQSMRALFTFENSATNVADNIAEAGVADFNSSGIDKLVISCLLYTSPSPRDS